MNKYMITSLLLAAAALLPLSSCGGNEPEPSEITAISVQPASLAFAAAGETLSLEVTTPFRPSLEVPSWISFKESTYSEKKMTFELTAAENSSARARSGVVTVSAPNCPSVTVPVSQETTREVVVDPVKLPDLSDDVSTLVSQLGIGWNLGNQFDAYINWEGDRYLWPDETAWGNPEVTPETFEGVKKAGFTTIRIPVTWLGAIGPADEGYPIDAAWMARVKEVVSWARDAGLYVIINTHHDENHGDDHWLDIKNAVNDAALRASIKQEIHAVWTQIAEAFKDCGQWLILEGFNEINDGGWGWSEDFLADPTRQCNLLNEWNQYFVDAVRATGGNNETRWLSVPTYAANPEYEKYAVLPSDPAGKLILSVHFYDPSEFTIGDKQYEQWGHTGKSGKKESWGDESHVRDVFGNLQDKYVSHGVPVYLGEFGCSMRKKTESTAWSFYLYYMEYVVKAARTYDLPCFVWDNGAKGTGKEHHPYIDHGTGEIVGNAKDVLEVMMKAWKEDSSAYTLESVYDNAPKP